MSCRNPFDSKVIIAHIKEQQRSQKPKPQDHRPLKEKRAKYQKHKRHFPSLNSLVRPEQVLPLVSLSGPSKIQAFRAVTTLWQTLNSLHSTFDEYAKAVKKLDRVTRFVQSAVKQGDEECVDIQEFLENLDLSIGPRACGICLTPFQVGGAQGQTTRVAIGAPVSEFPILLPCCHISCYGCITSWLRTRSACPSCSLQFESVEELRRTTDSQIRQYDGELAGNLASL